MAFFENSIKEQIKKDLDIAEGGCDINGKEFKPRETLDRIMKYYNSDFTETDKKNIFGRDMSFYNISKPKSLATAKEIDLDTKDVRLRAKKYGEYFKTLVAKEDLKRWANENYFGEILNQIVEEFSYIGHIVVKKDKYSKSGLSVVDLRNLFWDVGVEEREDMDFFIERLFYSPISFLRTAKDRKDWDISEIKNDLKEKKVNEIKVYERYGEVPGEWIDSKDEYPMACVVMANVGSKWYKLESYEVTEFPYREKRYEKVKGRYLGKGVVESLFDIQEEINRYANLRSLNFEISSKIFFLSGDADLTDKSILDVKTGQIFDINSGLERVDTRQHDYNTEMSEQKSWEQSANDMTFVNDLTMGERMPSGTVARGIMISNRAANKFFNQKREKLGLFIKKLYKEFIVKKLQKDLDKEKIIEYTMEDGDFSEVKDMVIRYMLIKEIKKRGKNNEDINNVGKLKQIIQKAIESRKVIPFNISKGFYKDMDYNFEIIITGESTDLDNQIKNLQWALAIISANPQVLQNEDTKNVIFSIMEKGGINPYSLFKGSQNAPMTPTKVPLPKKEQGLRIPEQEQMETKL